MTATSYSEVGPKELRHLDLNSMSQGNSDSQSIVNKDNSPHCTTASNLNNLYPVPATMTSLEQTLASGFFQSNRTEPPKISDGHDDMIALLTNQLSDKEQIIQMLSA